tara:strand:+ start:759 stop:1595 length:837 start_codon:yes stop_codon:yes gene_type:complete
MAQTEKHKAMMRAMRLAGNFDEVRAKDKPKELEKFRSKKAHMGLMEMSKLEDELKRKQDQQELYFKGQDNFNKIHKIGTGIYDEKIIDPNFVDKILDGENYDKIKVEREMDIPDANMTPVGHESMAKKFDFLNHDKKFVDPLIKEALTQNTSKELLKRLHTDSDGKIAITDIGLREKVYHNPDNVDVKPIGTNKVALVATSPSGHNSYRIISHFAPNGVPLNEHFKKIHGDKYQSEQMEVTDRRSRFEMESDANDLKEQARKEKERQRLVAYRKNNKS